MWRGKLIAPSAVVALWLACAAAAHGVESEPAGAAAPTQAQPARTLVCRMGGEMRWSLLAQFDVVQTQLNGKAARVPVIVALFDQLLFGRSSTAAKPDGSGLQPGQCAWPDRGLSPAEPDRVVADVEDFMLRQNVLWGNGSTLRSEATVFGGALSFQNKQAFTMQVTVIGDKFRVAAGTKPKALK